MTSSNANETIRILTVWSSDDNRQSLSGFLNRIPGLQLAAEARDSAKAMHLLKETSIDLVLIDFSKSDESAIELTRQIKQLDGKIRVLIVTASDTAEDIFATLDAGADGYLLQENLSKALDVAIRSVKLGAVWLDPGIARQMLEIVLKPTVRPTRTLPTGLMVMPLMPDENSLLSELAGSSCTDGVCLVDPSFLKKLKRFAPT